jgi:hypothetical protein
MAYMSNKTAYFSCESRHIKSISNRILKPDVMVCCVVNWLRAAFSRGDVGRCNMVGRYL